MPQWITGPDGSPVYVDANGTPTSPLGGGGATYNLDPAALYSLAQYDPSTPVPSVTRPAEPAPAAAPEPFQAPPPLPASPSAGPEGAPLPSPAPQVPTTVRQGESLGVNQAGFSTPKFQEVDRTSRGLPGEIAQAQQFYDKRADEVAGMSAHAAAQGRESALEQARIASEAATAEGQQRLVLAGLRDSFAQEEQDAYMASKAQSQAVKAQYEAALADFRGAGYNPAAIFDNKGFAITAAIASFGAGFLQAGGIQTTAMDGINKAIDRSIDQQLEAIKRKGEVASGFKQLWDMQRAESETDYEARQRVRGFILASTQDAIAAELSKYDSQLATAKGQEAVAKINQELVKTLTEVYKSADDNALRAAQQRISIWQTKVQASLQREGMNIERDKMAAAALANKGKQDPRLEQVVRDEKGNVVGFADTKEQKIKLQEQVTGADAVQRRLIELQERMRKAGSEYQGKGYKAFIDKEGAQLRSVYNDLLADIIRAKTGAAATEGERRNLEQILPFNSFTTGLFSGELPAESVAARFGIRAIDDIRTNARAQLRQPSAEEAAAFRGGAGNDVFATPEAIQRPAAENRDKPTDSEAVKLSARITSPGAGKAVEGTGAQVRDWYDAGLQRIGNDIRGKKGDDRKLSGMEVPDWFAGMSDLGQRAVAGDQDAISELTRFAFKGGNHATDLDNQIDAAATYYLIKATGKGPQDNPSQVQTGLPEGLDLSRFNAR